MKLFKLFCSLLIFSILTKFVSTTNTKTTTLLRSQMELLLKDYQVLDNLLDSNNQIDKINKVASNSTLSHNVKWGDIKKEEK